MRIEIIAEAETKRETIDRLVSEVPAMFPSGLGIKLVDGGTRYDVRQDNVAVANRLFSEEEKSDLDGLTKDGEFWFNITKIKRKHKPVNRENAIILLVHQSYVDFEMCDEVPEFVIIGGKENVYNGSYDDEVKVILAGIPNHPTQNSSKVVSHEIGHLVLDPIYGNYDFDGQPINHCENNVGWQACLMRELYPLRLQKGGRASDINEKIMDWVGVKFCPPCYAKLVGAGAK